MIANAGRKVELKSSKYRSSEKLLSSKSNLFKAPKDCAVFWTGWAGGEDPLKCNYARAKMYATEKQKVTLETTEGGKLLESAYKWFATSSLFTDSEAKAVWRYASELYLYQAEGHVVSFALDREHPNYCGTSIYHTLERPILKEKSGVFLSEIVTPPPLDEEFLKDPKLDASDVREVLEGVFDWLEIARSGWQQIETLSAFTAENRGVFLANPAFNIGGSESNVEAQLDALSTLDESLEKYILRAKAIVESWEHIYRFVRIMDAFYKETEVPTSESIFEDAKEEAVKARMLLQNGKELILAEDKKLVWTKCVSLTPYCEKLL